MKERERVVNNHFYHMVHKKEEGTYHSIEKLKKEMPRFLSPWERLALQGISLKKRERESKTRGPKL